LEFFRGGSKGNSGDQGGCGDELTFSTLLE
jgi:hypothetical protein